MLSEVTKSHVKLRRELDLSPRVFVFVQAGIRLAIGFSLLAIFGCHNQVDPPEFSGDSTIDAEMSFSLQLQRGRLGQGDRIEVGAAVISDAQLEDLASEDRWLEQLICDAGRVSDSGAARIAALPNLWHLRLRLSPIGDQGLEAISKRSSLRVLNLPHCTATPAGVARLASLEALSNLRLGGQNLDATTAAAVANITSLKQLHLIGVPVDNEGLRSLANLPKLQSLYLDDSAVTQEGWDWLFETHPHLHVHVNQRHPDRGPDHQEQHQHD